MNGSGWSLRQILLYDEQGYGGEEHLHDLVDGTGRMGLAWFVLQLVWLYVLVDEEGVKQSLLETVAHTWWQVVLLVVRRVGGWGE